MTTARPPVAPLTHLPEPTTARWRPLRAGLQNLWQFDHSTRFVFHCGRLLLRGRNGAGKTKVVELLLPFLLEGRLDPRRLDPFGNQSRKMHYNLLHEGNRNLQTNLGYAWLEFGRLDEDGPHYLTIGAGLKARRSSNQVTSWFFLAHDRRIDVDLDLLETDRRPRSIRSLGDTLGEDGVIYSSAREYRAAVDRELFGLGAQQYESLVEALLRLRQPHLSERLDPTQVAAVLSDSLPPLDAERVREVAEGFERIETHRRELADRRTTLTAVEGFLGDYRTYVGAVAAVRAAGVLGTDSGVREATRASKTEEKARAGAARAQAERERRREAVTGELATARTRIRTIQTSDAYRAVQQLVEAEAQIDVAGARAGRLADRQEAARDQAQEAAARRDTASGRREAQAGVVAEQARATRRLAAAADLDAAQVVLSAQLAAVGVSPQVDSARGTVVATVTSREEAIGRLRIEGEKVTRAERHEEREAERLADAQEIHRDALVAVERAEVGHAGALDVRREACERWAEGLMAFDLGAPLRTEILDAPAEDAAALVRCHAAPFRERFDVETAAAALALARIDERTATTRAACESLAGATHSAPPVPAWRRSDRVALAGAPLYLLLEFDDTLSPEGQAGVEAALEAAGLLDAWVTPGGALLDAETLDAVALPRPRGPGLTLAEVTRPTPHGEVVAQVILDVAAGISVLEQETSDVAAGAHAWVAVDGRFGLGPLQGRAKRAQVGYIGETARAAERARRLAELERELEVLEREGDAVRGQLARCRERRQRLDEEVLCFPDAEAVLAARAALASAATQLEQAAGVCEERQRAHVRAVEAVRTAREVLGAVAQEEGLGAHLESLEELAGATTAWQMACGAWIGQAAVLCERLDAMAAAETAALDAKQRALEAGEERMAADRELSDLQERVRTLRTVVGSTGETLRAEFERVTASERELEAEGRRLGQALLEGAREIGAREQACVDARAVLKRTEEERAEAVRSFVALATLGVLALLGDAGLDGAGGGKAAEGAGTAAWPPEEAVVRAHALAAAGPPVPEDAEAVRRMLESAQNTMAHRQHELHRALVAGVRLFGRMEEGVLIHDVQYLGKTYSLATLVGELEQDVAERESRLARGEQELLEGFLTGELHEHVRGRIREAEALITRMNRLLADCPTAAGQRLRLAWHVDDDAPPGTKQAVELLLRGANLLTASQLEQLRTWLHERLRKAREGDAVASLQERIAGVLDYRRWHAFHVEFSGGQVSSWRRLTRRTHGTGSGGEKAVMLHLPLFVAMAAHYSGQPTAPRLIVLDEVFAGIDRGVRGQLMHLLVKLDLDAVLTSHEEWGCYAELDGISTYHLLRDPEVPGVLPEWFVWDGNARWEMKEGAGAL